MKLNFKRIIIFPLVVFIDGHKMNGHEGIKDKDTSGKRSEENEENMNENQGEWFLLFMQKMHDFTMSDKCK